MPGAKTQKRPWINVNDSPGMAAIIFPGRNLFYFWTRSGCIAGRDGSEGAVYPLTRTLRRKD